jgi:sugar-specific transcriptional regulator TrmB
MIVQQEFLNKLKDFGLNSYESKLWAALLSRGISTAGELSDIANVPRSRSYDVLESLERKGFIIMKLGKPIRYIAVPPAEVLERMKKKVISESENKTKLLNELRESEVLEELNVLHTQGIELVEPTDLTGILKGRTNLYSHIEAMIKNAEHSIVILTTEEGLTRKADNMKNSLQKAKAKGVKIRIAAPITKKSLAAAKKLSSLAQIRHAEVIKARFCIIDGKELIFTLLDDKETHPSYDVGVWVNSKFFAKAQEDSFSVLWGQMKDFNKVKTK